MGRLSFGCFAVWGPRATSRLVSLFRVLRGAESPSSPAFADTLRWWSAFLADFGTSSSYFRLRPSAALPVVLYTDAEGIGGLGACLFRDGAAHWWQLRVPAFCRAMAHELGYPRGMPIFLYEAMAPFVACRFWQRLLTGRTLLVFVDNLTLFGALRKGRSKTCLALNCVVSGLRALLHAH